jgi:hypothetical protein
MSLALAIADLKNILLDDATDDINLQIEVLAEEYDLKPLFLKNRAIADMGDLSTWADRQRAARAADQGNQERTKKKLLLTRIEDTLRATPVTANNIDDVLTIQETANQLREELGIQGRWQIVKRTQRRAPRHESFEQLARRICKEFGIDPSIMNL